MSTERTLRTRAALHRILGRQNLTDNSFVEVECAVMEVAALCDEGKLILLCYKKPRRQQGHLGRERARWVAIWRRRVAIEDGLCRSVRTGSAAGRVAGLRTG